MGKRTQDSEKRVPKILMSLAAAVLTERWSVNLSLEGFGLMLMGFVQYPLELFALCCKQSHSSGGIQLHRGHRI